MVALSGRSKAEDGKIRIEIDLQECSSDMPAGHMFLILTSKMIGILKSEINRFDLDKILISQISLVSGNAQNITLCPQLIFGVNLVEFLQILSVSHIWS